MAAICSSVSPALVSTLKIDAVSVGSPIFFHCETNFCFVILLPSSLPTALAAPPIAAAPDLSPDPILSSTPFSIKNFSNSSSIDSVFLVPEPPCRSSSPCSGFISSLPTFSFSLPLACKLPWAVAAITLFAAVKFCKNESFCAAIACRTLFSRFISLINSALSNVFANVQSSSNAFIAPGSVVCPVTAVASLIPCNRSLNLSTWSAGTTILPNSFWIVLPPHEIVSLNPTSICSKPGAASNGTAS